MPIILILVTIALIGVLCWKCRNMDGSLMRMHFSLLCDRYIKKMQILRVRLKL